MHEAQNERDRAYEAVRELVLASLFHAASRSTF